MKTKLSLLAICLILIAPLVLSGCKEPEAETPDDNSLGIDGTWIYTENYKAGERGKEWPAYSYEFRKMEIKGNTCNIYERGETDSEEEAFYNAIKNGEPVPESKWESFPHFEGIISIDEDKVSYQLLIQKEYYDGEFHILDTKKESIEYYINGTINKELNKIIFNQVKEDGETKDLKEDQYMIFIKK